jgi:hypothetical protein|nr:MAG TPA_asm: hypothetical protein [Caudoviricetes sp.]
MNSLEIREFEQSIINLFNECGLPMEIKRLIVNDIAGQINRAADNQINVELEERNKEKESEVSANGAE